MRGDVARGWESKSVEAQQDEAARRAPGASRRPLTQAEREELAQRRTLELARARVLADLRVATLPAHRAVLERTLEALELKLRA